MDSIDIDPPALSPTVLGAPPSALAGTRTALHRLAAYVVAPTRHAAVGRFGLRATPGGFGTPRFGQGRRVRVDGVALVDEHGAEAHVAPITSLAAAAAHLGSAIDAETAAEHDTPALGDIDADLGIDPGAAAWLADWFAMAFEALEQVRYDEGSVEPSIPQLWPGHFDPAIEEGDEDHRASYGASPGDDTIDEPYLYVSVWWPDRVGIAGDAAWQTGTFVGRTLAVSAFPAGADPVGVATDFWRTTRDRLSTHR
jgi:hypothetical protein